MLNLFSKNTTTEKKEDIALIVQECENTCITVNTNLALFNKDIFDDIRNFTKDFDHWTPYILKRNRNA